MKTEDVLAAMKQGPFKVVPHTKTAGANGLENCHVWTHGGKEQGFLWVAKYRGGNEFSLDHDSGTALGDFFFASDFEPYIEPFKVGDTVRIRDTLVAGQEYDGGCFFTAGMDKFKGKTAKIIRKNNFVTNHFFLDIDKEYWDWTPSMLEHAEVNGCSDTPASPAFQFTRVVFAKHQGNCKEFLFEVPDNLTLNPGHKVLCDTMQGESDAIVSSPVYQVNKGALEALCHANGAYLPLKKIIGRYELITEDKPDAV